MTTIYRLQKKEHNYVVLDKRFLQNREISWQAKGLLSYMLSMPDDWQFNLRDLAKRSVNGRDSTQSIIKELIAAGYIRRRQLKEKGKFAGNELLIFEVPDSDVPRTGKPDTESPEMDNPEPEKPSLLSNKELSNKSTKKDICRKQVYDADSNEMKLVDYLIKRIKINNPNFREPNKQKWSDTFRKMMQIDNRNPREISELILYVQTDDFEMANVLSPEKLRKRYDQLVIKMKKGALTNSSTTNARVQSYQFNPNEGEE